MTKVKIAFASISSNFHETFKVSNSSIKSIAFNNYNIQNNTCELSRRISVDEQNTEPCKLPTGKTLQKRQAQQSEETVPTREPLYSYCHLNIGLLLSSTSSYFAYLCNRCALQTSRSTQMSVFCRSMTRMWNYHYHATSGSPVYRVNNIKNK